MFVTYNGVQLQVDHISEWSDRNIYSEDNTERLYRHVILGVNFVIHPQTLAGLGISLATSAPQVIASLKARLLTPRQPLLVTAGSNPAGGGNIILQSPAIPSPGFPLPRGPGGSAWVDARTGPN